MKIVLLTLVFAAAMNKAFGLTQLNQDGSDNQNRDGELPADFPLMEDLRVETARIVEAHEVLRSALRQFLGIREANMTVYLVRMINRQEPFKDEYGETIPGYKKVFRFIQTQHEEVLQKNYAAGQFETDKLDLCSVARYLSHQPKVMERKTLMKRMSEALGYKCHPCTPYKRKEHGPVEEPITSDLDIDYETPMDCKSIDPIAIRRLVPTPFTHFSTPTRVTDEWYDSNNGQAKFGLGCDFWGGDRLNVYSGADDCGGLCLSYDWCTHFIYLKDFCMLKSFEYKPKPSDCNHCAFCGWVVERESSLPNNSSDTTNEQPTQSPAK